MRWVWARGRKKRIGVWWGWKGDKSTIVCGRKKVCDGERIGHTIKRVGRNGKG